MNYIIKLKIKFKIENDTIRFDCVVFCWGGLKFGELTTITVLMK